MIRCLAVDDETYATKMLADYIQKVPYLELAGISNSAIAALAMIQNGGIDLVFLDVQMPELTGIEFLKLCGHTCKVVLTTAYSEYALEGFEHDVVDYLLKPIAFERFLKAAQKAFQLLNKTNSPPANPASDSKAVDYLFVKGNSKNKYLKVAHDEILYIEGMKNYVSIFLTSGRIITYQTLRDLEKILPTPPFYRVHKSYIVSIHKIRMVDGNVLFLGDQSIPIGDIYRDAFFKQVCDHDR
ncbi:MAG TPA: LytTR family DNA-binding domain-containing protein [Mucilaginibacter sp.]|nr:LytTR family DNA-binding domain-containing protein [Mucilaginibacter sp.]